MRSVGFVMLLFAGGIAYAQQQAVVPAVPQVASVRAIEPPATMLPPEPASAGVTKFSFIAYGDHRCSCSIEAPAEDQRAHAAVVESIVERAKARAGTASPIRFVLSSGDAMFRGQDPERWAVYTAIAEKITRVGGIPLFFSVGNHDVTGMPPGDPGRALGLHYTLQVMSKLMPPEGSPRRLNGYPTYAFGFGNSFFIAIDSNIASDTIQLAWVADQLDHLDRARYPHVIVFFHHPIFTSGPHSGIQPPDPVTHERGPDRVEPSTLAMRTLYAPLFRKHHVRMTVSGHDHLFEHWVERYVDGGRAYRRDDVVSGGGGAPIYTYQGEPQLEAYLKGAADQQVKIEHLAKPGPNVTDNPHHFVIVDVDGDKLSIEVVPVSGPLAPYNGKTTIALNP